MPHNTQDNRTPCILFIDAYDSFSNNIQALAKEQINADIRVIKMNNAYFQGHEEDFYNYLKSFDAVVAGPGPGSPNNAVDVGLIQKLWDLSGADLLPVLGICLGFQSLALTFGARIERLHEPRHGVIARVIHKGESLFAGTGGIMATQYNSLHVNIGQVEQVGRPTCNLHQLWVPTISCPLLQPLAWVLDDIENGPLLAGVRHIVKPFWGVQYHPESVCTDKEGASIIRNWWTEAQKWNLSKRCVRHKDCLISGHTKALNYTPKSLKTLPGIDTGLSTDFADSIADSKAVRWKSVPLETLPVPLICEAVKMDANEFVLLESATDDCGTPVNEETGRFSIIGLVNSDNSEHLQYHVSNQTLFQYIGDRHNSVAHPVSDIWAYLKKYMSSRRACNGPSASPFWGGLMGFVSYEACLENIQIETCGKVENKPDLCFVFVERSIVIDHIFKQLYIQSTRKGDDNWLDDTQVVINSIMQPRQFKSKSVTLAPRPLRSLGTAAIKELRTSSCSQDIPAQLTKMVADVKDNEVVREHYFEQVRQCQEEIHAGNSYELCLTRQTLVALPLLANHGTDWELYRRLRRLNPAPFGAYVRLHCKAQSVTILSSSPERFLRWTRENYCQSRPIKGTVKKTSNMTFQKAKAILKSSKEQAENLMIVDLIRHDFHGVVGTGNVHVKKLMEIEEYATVYQLVSVIECQLPHPTSQSDQTGIDVLVASLPPGSMTGAPKKRSCEILQQIENKKPRGIYSGVLGYLDVGGGGDFSVVIRTAYKWDDDFQVSQYMEDGHEVFKKSEIWNIGAGGAVTSQSTALGEWEEMCAKRDPLLNICQKT